MTDEPDPSRRRSLAVGLTGLAAAATMLPKTADAQAVPDSRLATVIKRDKLLVATFTTSPPLCFMDDSGKNVGFEIDLCRMIAKGLLDDENKVEFVEVDSSGRWPAVLSGRADFGITGTTIYPDRVVRVAFTAPYMDSGISVLVRKDAGIKTLEDLNKPGNTLSNLSNPQMAARAKRYLPNMATLSFETPAAMILSVKSGQATAMQMDTPVVGWAAKNNPDLEVIPTPLGNVQNNAIFLKPGDFTWWLALDTIVKELRWGSRYEEYAAAFEKWFGAKPPPQRFYLKG